MKILILALVSIIATAQFPQRTSRRKYGEDSGKYGQDDSGKYVHDKSGAYDPDYSGQYVPDDSGKYVSDNSGKYHPDYTGMYVTDKSGRYNYDEVLRQHKAKQIRKSRSISSNVPRPSNMYLPFLTQGKNETLNHVAVDVPRKQEVDGTNVADVTKTENNSNITNGFKLFPYASSFKGKPNNDKGVKYVASKFKTNNVKISPKYGKITPSYPKLEEILKPTLRKLMGYGFSIVYNKINRSHVVVNYGPNQNYSQKLIPVPPSRNS